MKSVTKFILISLTIFLSNNLYSQVKISTENSNTLAHGSAALEVESTNKGLLFPRVSNYSTISSPSAGLVVYDLTTFTFKFYGGSTNGWLTLYGGGIAVPYSGATGNLNLGTHNLSADSSNANTLISTQDITVNGLRIGKGPGTGTNNGNNTAIGYQALSNNTRGSNNTAIGNNALNANISGLNNLALGVLTLEKNTVGSFNTGLGYRTLNENKAGSSNTANGYDALVQLGSNYTSSNPNLTYNNNTALGYNGGNNLIEGSGNIAIGANTNFPFTTGSYQLNIGNEIYGKYVNDASNNVQIGIGTSTPTATLDVNGTARISNIPTTTGVTSVLVRNPTTGLISEQNIPSLPYPQRIMKFLLTSDQTLTASSTTRFITWNTTPEITVGKSIGSMGPNGVFNVSNAGKYKVIINYDVSGDPDAWATTSSTNFSLTRYLQSSGTQPKGTIIDIIDLPNGGDPIYWRPYNNVIIYSGSSIIIEKLE